MLADTCFNEIPLEALIEQTNARFVSGNTVPVERAAISHFEWTTFRVHLKSLSAPDKAAALAVEALIKKIDARFISGTAVLPERVALLAREWAVLLEHLKSATSSGEGVTFLMSDRFIR